ncbi:response regulator [Candidatus Roizmanbacteria bacterium]|nr:response regulator [Candidatus Roizmanbacteria bacterium]
MKKVLIIEDDIVFQKIYQRKLREEGFEVLHAHVGKQGLELAKAQKPNLIMLDIMLPGGMNGFDVLEQLKNDMELKKVPVVVLTNLNNEEKTAKDLGASDYIVKADTSIKEVTEKVKKLVS